MELPRPGLPLRIISALYTLAWIAFACTLVIIAITHFLRAYQTEGALNAKSLIAPAIFLIIGLLLLSPGRSFAISLLPFRYTFDREQMICGHHWRGHWIHKTDLTGLQAIVTGPAWSSQRWPWILSIRRTSDKTSEPTFIYRCPEGHRSEQHALHHAREVGTRVAAYLNVPLDHAGWSPGLMVPTAPSV